MGRIIFVIALSLVSSACSKSKKCPPQTVETFVGAGVPKPELATAFKDFASRNKVCGTGNKAQIVMSGARPDAVDALDAALKAVGFLNIPGRGGSEGATMTFGYAKTRDEKNGDLVEIAFSSGDDCEFGDVCIENRGYSVVLR